MAFELGASRNTVQNWKKGTSEPTLRQAITSFKAININKMPYLFQAIHAYMEIIKSSKDFIIIFFNYATKGNI